MMQQQPMFQMGMMGMGMQQPMSTSFERSVFSVEIRFKSNICIIFHRCISFLTFWKIVMQPMMQPMMGQYGQVRISHQHQPMYNSNTPSNASTSPMASVSKPSNSPHQQNYQQMQNGKFMNVSSVNTSSPSPVGSLYKTNSFWNVSFLKRFFREQRKECQ